MMLTTYEGGARTADTRSSQPGIAIDVRHARDRAGVLEEVATKLEIRDLSVHYGRAVALRDINLRFPERRITALIGPSGAGKSTLLRAINRMHDGTPGAVVEGQVLLDGQPIYGPEIDPILVRRRVGMVFQRPNPFAKSIFDNVAYGLRVGRTPKAVVQKRVEAALRAAALWDEVKDRLKRPALALSGGQQQRLCIARALAVEPEVILMDEPTSALDPVATLRIEELMLELSKRYTIVIVTHNMQQAARVSDVTVFLTPDQDRAGVVVEAGATARIFTNPSDPRTEDYITGRVG